MSKPVIGMNTIRKVKKTHKITSPLSIVCSLKKALNDCSGILLVKNTPCASIVRKEAIKTKTKMMRSMAASKRPMSPSVKPNIPQKPYPSKIARAKCCGPEKVARNRRMIYLPIKNEE